MKLERCPKCNAAASIPLVSGLPIPNERMVINGSNSGSHIGRIMHVGKKPSNTLCLCCRHRWHSEFRFDMK